MAHPREPYRRRAAQCVPAPLQLKQVTSFADAAQLLDCWTVQAQQQQPASLMQSSPSRHRKEPVVTCLGEARSPVQHGPAARVWPRAWLGPMLGRDGRHECSSIYKDTYIHTERIMAVD